MTNVSNSAQKTSEDTQKSHKSYQKEQCGPIRHPQGSTWEADKDPVAPQRPAGPGCEAKKRQKGASKVRMESPEAHRGYQGSQNKYANRLKRGDWVPKDIHVNEHQQKIIVQEETR